MRWMIFFVYCADTDNRKDRSRNAPERKYGDRLGPEPPNLARDRNAFRERS